MFLGAGGGISLQGGRGADDVGQLAGDLALPGAVVLRVSDLTRSLAFLVAPPIATIRAICSLTAASRKHLNSRTLNETGTISSRMLRGSGRNS